MSIADCLRVPEDPPSPSLIRQRLEAFAASRGIEVRETDLSPLTKTAGYELAGTIGASGGHHVAYVHPEQSEAEKATTVAHELAHLLLEFGPLPPKAGGVVVPTEQLEDRAEAAEDVFARAVGLKRSTNPQAAMLKAVEAVGWQPVVAACQLAAVARGGGKTRA